MLRERPKAAPTEATLATALQREKPCKRKRILKTLENATSQTKDFIVCYDDPNRTQDKPPQTARKRFWVDRFVIARYLLGGRILISVKLTSFSLSLGWHYSLDADQNQVRDC